PTPKVEDSQTKSDEVVVDKTAAPPEVPDPAATAKVDAPAPDATTKDQPAVVADPELSEQDDALLNALPEAERQGMSSRLKQRLAFMDHYLNPDKPAEDIRKHLEERSPSRYTEVESAMLA